MKKEWKKPQLTVLVRTRPEESILAACKTAGQAAVDASTFNTNCLANDTFGGCQQCSSTIGS
jgi:hypothetical protein